MFLQYEIFKVLHLIGVVMLIGNVTVTAFWKTVADRTGDPLLVAFAQRIVIYADWFFTLSGIVLIIVGGYGATWTMGLNPFRVPWIVNAEILFLISGLVWLGLLVPVQIRQSRQARKFALDGEVPRSYWIAGRWWLVWGIGATVPLVAAVYVMIVK